MSCFGVCEKQLYDRLPRLNEKLARYNSSHTSIIERLSQLEKQKESANEVSQKLGVVEKASAEKTTKIESLMKEKS